MEVVVTIFLMVLKLLMIKKLVNPLINLSKAFVLEIKEFVH